MFTKPELKPCPFCGSTKIELEYYDKPAPYWQICCNNCGACTRREYVKYEYVNQAFESIANTIEKVVNDWNKRV